MSTKQERVDHANQLIRIIAAHGRRFFYCQKYSRTARVELRNGRVYFVDDYSDKAIYTHPTNWGNKWRGFSHGGTLRDLVEKMRDYITHGKPIPPGYIVIKQLGKDGLDGNIWGYDVASAEAVRAAAYELPIIAQ